MYPVVSDSDSPAAVRVMRVVVPDGRYSRCSRRAVYKYVRYIWRGGITLRVSMGLLFQGENSDVSMDRQGRGG
jgi:hypothetical protein